MVTRAKTHRREASISLSGPGKARGWVLVLVLAAIGLLVLCQRSSAELVFSDPEVLNSNAYAVGEKEDDNIWMDTDGAGNWVAVWDSQEDLGGTIGIDYDILVSLSADDGVTWTEAVPLNSHAFTDTETEGDGAPRVATDGLGNWIAVWESTYELGGTIGPDTDILTAYSVDNGLTWSDPVALNTNAAIDAGRDYDPQIATDGAGTWLVVWWSRDDLGGTIGEDEDILVARSTDSGINWTDPVPLNTNAATDWGNDRQVQLATDGGGNWVVIWGTNDDLGGAIGTDRDILVARSTNNGAAWTAPLPLNTNAGTDWGHDGAPHIATDGAGNWVAVWVSNDDLGGTIDGDRDILVARSTDNGANWTAPAPLNTNAAVDGGDDSRPKVATDAAGLWVVLWDSEDDLDAPIGDDADILMAASGDDGVSWTDPGPLNSNATYDEGTDKKLCVATDGAGTWLTAWKSNQWRLEEPERLVIGHDDDILIVCSWDNWATVTDPVPLDPILAADTDNDAAPQVATDGAGTWVAVWLSSEDLGGTIGTDGDILVARSTDNGANWTDAVPLNSNAATDAGDDGKRDGRLLATDGAGNWIAVWESSDDLSGTIGTDLDILVACSSDNGFTWTPPVPLNTNAATDSGDDDEAVVATDGMGNWVVIWDSEDDLGGTTGEDGDILLARSTDNGATWSYPAPLNTNAATDSGGDNDSFLMSDGAGLWLALWESKSDLGGTIGTEGDILLAHSVDNGATWTAPVPLNTNAATDSGEDDNPIAATDGNGNWVVVWHSRENLGGIIGTDNDIFVACSADNGLTWTDPVPIDPFASEDFEHDKRPQVATDGEGTWLVVWGTGNHPSGITGDDSDVLTVCSTDNGATWSVPAALNTNAATDFGDDAEPVVASDGAGNWVVVWESSDDLDGTIGSDLDILFSRATDAPAVLDLAVSPSVAPLFSPSGSVLATASASPNAADDSTLITITATIDETGTGGSSVFSAQFTVDGIVFFALDPADGAFDEVTEDVTVTFSLASVGIVEPGVYEVCVTGTDENGVTGLGERVYLVVYDASAGFVTGGGWIWSPQGAYTPNADAEGKANFGFVSKYKKGASEPTGNTEFRFAAVDLNFHSDNYEWLVVAGAKAMFKGTGTINDEGPFKFMLTAGDGDLKNNGSPDTFRIRIWEEDDGAEITIYDNQMGDTDDADATTELGGGSIIIHTQK